eukprot:TRINITY_DN3490_c0_g1_i12.p1 TRINITY_DN3490_c0_g1~~TRINITY_DN3490_c0_g1_i12.p1  ORF type:complete len:2511 (-),score=1393.56 TRINITY_DN3490_c0_g1_i12:8-7090(-)
MAGEWKIIQAFCDHFGVILHIYSSQLKKNVLFLPNSIRELEYIDEINAFQLLYLGQNRYKLLQKKRLRSLSRTSSNEFHSIRRKKPQNISSQPPRGRPTRSISFPVVGNANRPPIPSPFIYPSRALTSPKLEKVYIEKSKHLFQQVKKELEEAEKLEEEALGLMGEKPQVKHKKTNETFDQQIRIMNERLTAFNVNEAMKNENRERESKVDYESVKNAIERERELLKEIRALREENNLLKHIQNNEGKRRGSLNHNNTFLTSEDELRDSLNESREEEDHFKFVNRERDSPKSYHFGSEAMPSHYNSDVTSEFTVGRSDFMDEDHLSHSGFQEGSLQHSPVVSRVNSLRYQKEEEEDDQNPHSNLISSEKKRRIISDLTGSNERLTLERDSYIRKNEGLWNMNRELALSKGELEAKLNEKEIEIVSLHEENEAHGVTISELNSQLKRQAQISPKLSSPSLSMDNSELKGKFEELERETKRIREESFAREERFSDLKKELEALRVEFELKEEELKKSLSFKIEVDHLNEELEKKNEKISLLGEMMENSNETHRKQIEALKELKSTHLERIEELEGINLKSEREIEELRGENRRKDEEIERLKEEKASLERRSASSPHSDGGHEVVMNSLDIVGKGVKQFLNEFGEDSNEEAHDEDHEEVQEDVEENHEEIQEENEEEIEQNEEMEENVSENQEFDEAIEDEEQGDEEISRFEEGQIEEDQENPSKFEGYDSFPEENNQEETIEENEENQEETVEEVFEEEQNEDENLLYEELNVLRSNEEIYKSNELELNNRIEELEESNENYRIQCEENDSTIQSMKEENDSQSLVIESMRTEADQNQIQFNLMKIELEELKKSIPKEKIVEISEEQEKEIDENADEIVFEVVDEEIRSGIEGYIKHKTQVLMEQREKDEKIVKKEERRKSLEKEKEDQSRERDLLHQENVKLRGEIDELMNSLESERTSFKNQIKEMNEKSTEMEMNISNLNREMERARSNPVDNHEKEGEKRKLEEELNKLKREMEESMISFKGNCDAESCGGKFRHSHAEEENVWAALAGLSRDIESNSHSSIQFRESFHSKRTEISINQLKEQKNALEQFAILHDEFEEYLRMNSNEKNALGVTIQSLLTENKMIEDKHDKRMELIQDEMDEMQMVYQERINQIKGEQGEEKNNVESQDFTAMKIDLDHLNSLLNNEREWNRQRKEEAERTDQSHKETVERKNEEIQSLLHQMNEEKKNFESKLFALESEMSQKLRQAEEDHDKELNEVREKAGEIEFQLMERVSFLENRMENSMEAKDSEEIKGELNEIHRIYEEHLLNERKRIEEHYLNEIETINILNKEEVHSLTLQMEEIQKEHEAELNRIQGERFEEEKRFAEELKRRSEEDEEKRKNSSSASHSFNDENEEREMFDDSIFQLAQNEEEIKAIRREKEEMESELNAEIESLREKLRETEEKLKEQRENSFSSSFKEDSDITHNTILEQEKVKGAIEKVNELGEFSEHLEEVNQRELERIRREKDDQISQLKKKIREREEEEEKGREYFVEFMQELNHLGEQSEEIKEKISSLPKMNERGEREEESKETDRSQRIVLSSSNVYGEDNEGAFFSDSEDTWMQSQSEHQTNSLRGKHSPIDKFSSSRLKGRDSIEGIFDSVKLEGEEEENERDQSKLLHLIEKHNENLQLLLETEQKTSAKLRGMLNEFIDNAQVRNEFVAEDRDESFVEDNLRDESEETLRRQRDLIENLKRDLEELDRIPMMRERETEEMMRRSSEFERERSFTRSDSHLDESFRDLLKENEELRERVENLEDEIGEMKLRMLHLLDNTATVKEQNEERFRRQIDSLEEKLKESESEFQSASNLSYSGGAKEKYDQFASSLVENEVNDLKNQNEELREQIQGLEDLLKAREKLEGDYDILNQEMNIATNELKLSYQEKEQLEHQLNGFKEEIQNLREEASRYADDHEAEIQDLIGEKEEINREKEELINLLKNMENQLVQTEEKLKRELNVSKGNSNRQLEEVKHNLSMEVESSNKLRSDLESFQTNEKALQEKLSNLDNAFKALRENHNRLTNHNSQVEVRNEYLESENDRLHEQCVRFEKKSNEIESKAFKNEEALLREIHQLKLGSNFDREKSENYQTNKRKWKAQKERLRGERQKAMELVEQASAECDRLREELNLCHVQLSQSRPTRVDNREFSVLLQEKNQLIQQLKMKEGELLERQREEEYREGLFREEMAELVQRNTIEMSLLKQNVAREQQKWMQQAEKREVENRDLRALVGRIARLEDINANLIFQKRFLLFKLMQSERNNDQQRGMNYSSPVSSFVFDNSNSNHKRNNQQLATLSPLPRLKRAALVALSIARMKKLLKIHTE